MSTNERRPAGAASETSKGAGVNSIVPRRSDRLARLRWWLPTRWELLGMAAVYVVVRVVQEVAR